MEAAQESEKYEVGLQLQNAHTRFHENHFRVLRYRHICMHAYTEHGDFIDILFFPVTHGLAWF
jgi:hypothetical protein